MLIYALVAGVLFGLYFSLVGIGLNLVFGVMRIVNLAHGDILMLGAFIALGVVTLAGIDPLFAVPLAFVLFLLAGLLLYWVLVPAKMVVMASMTCDRPKKRMIESISGLAEPCSRGTRTQ